MANKIDANITGLSFAEEASLKVLPATPIWYALEPNKYADFGGAISTVARAPITASRQNSKGTATGVTAAAGFNIDYTQNNLTRLLQGFFFADAHEKPDTQALNAAAIPLTAVTATQFQAASGLAQFLAGDLIFASGFGVPANNGLAPVTASVAGLITTSKALTAEASPPASARVHAVGIEFAAGDVGLVYAGGLLTLTSTAYDFTTAALQVGEWVFIGGDVAVNQFANNVPGYARIKSIAAHAIVCDKTTWIPVTDAGSTKTIRLFFGTFIRNEDDPALIKRRTYQLERKVGPDAAGVQSEYLVGAVANEMIIDLPKKDKLMCDMTFMALDNEQRNGTLGVKAGTRIGVLGENAFNTSHDVYRLRLTLLDPTTTLPSALFAYITDGKLMIKNNVTEADAVGVFGAFDTITGNFTVQFTCNAYFSTVAAVQAVRNYTDSTVDLIMASNNSGFVYDVPLIGVGGGKLDVQKDQAVKLPLTVDAGRSTTGYTASVTIFAYLPNAAMPL